MRLFAAFFACCLCTFAALSACHADEATKSYAVVVSRATHDDADWKPVVDALVAKHDAQVITYDKLIDSLDPLAQQFPRYACFVATPAEASRQFVADVHRLTRRLDDDPYTDVIWGILTGYDADNALTIARHREPLVIRRAAAGTEIALEMCKEGVWYCELNKHRMVRKQSGQDAGEEKGPGDTTKALVDSLNEYKADLFVTSGHATERDWQIGYRYRNGSFRSKAGNLFGLDTENKKHAIDSDNPKVYMPVGNCLMGHIDGPDAMALAFMNSAGVHQMIGYTVVTWFGYGGWGCLDYFVEQPGRYTFAESFFANHQALLHRLETEFPELADKNPSPGSRTGFNAGGGLLFDRDVVALYGDPAWEARMADGKKAWSQSLTEENGVYTFEVVPQRGPKSFKPINTNGAQRGWRPIVEVFPHRLANIELLEGESLQPLITDNFLLIPNPREHKPGQRYRVTFRATKATD